MKKIVSLVALLILVFSADLFAQSKKDIMYNLRKQYPGASVVDSRDHFTIYAEDNTNGYADSKGNVIVPPGKYSNIMKLYGYFWVTIYEEPLQNSKKGVLDLQGNELVPCLFVQIEGANGGGFMVRETWEDQPKRYSASDYAPKPIVSPRQEHAAANSQATPLSESSVDTEGMSPEELYHLGMSQAQSGNYSQAKILFQKAVDGDNSDAMIAMGDLALESALKNYEIDTYRASMMGNPYAISAVQQTYQISLQGVRLWYQRALAYGNQMGAMRLQAMAAGLSSQSGGGGQYGSGSQGQSTQQSSGGFNTYNCNVCNGSGRVCQTVTTAIASGQDYYCTGCKQRVGSNHTYSTCWSCNGSGTYKLSK